MKFSARHCSTSISRILLRETGLAFAVLAVWLLSLLAPMHLVSRMASELRLAGYQTDSSWTLCLPTGQTDGQGQPITLCPAKAACGGAPLLADTVLVSRIDVAVGLLVPALRSRHHAARHRRVMGQPRAPPMARHGRTGGASRHSFTTNRRSMMIRNLLGAAIAATTLVNFTAPAMAHATLETREAAVGTTYRAVLRVPHGCGSEATHTVRVQIPEGFFNVKPMPKAGWELGTVTGPYGNAYDNHGTQLTEGVQEIVWSGGNLPNEWYDEFIFRGTFAGDLPVDTVFYFPAVQECATGEEAWIDTSGDESASHPAPGVTLRANPRGH